MKRKRSTEEQSIGILNEAGQAGEIREVCRRHIITEPKTLKQSTSSANAEGRRRSGSAAARSVDRQGRIEEAKLIRRLHEPTERYPRFGYLRIHAILPAGGVPRVVRRDRLRLIKEGNGYMSPANNAVPIDKQEQGAHR